MKNDKNTRQIIVKTHSVWSCFGNWKVVDKYFLSIFWIFISNYWGTNTDLCGIGFVVLWQMVVAKIGTYGFITTKF